MIAYHNVKSDAKLKRGKKAVCMFEGQWPVI